MYIYRPHRGSLDEAMRECKEFETKEEMISYISAESACLTGKPLYDPQDIIIGSSVINDYRIGWADCRHVLVKRMGNERFLIPQCIGWCATEYRK